MKKIICETIVGIILTAIFSITMSAQCRSGRIQSNPENKKYINYVLPATTKFFIKLDNDINSSNYRAGDIVSFTVMENVHGHYVKNADTDPKEEKSFNLTDKAPIVVIPEKSKGFGRVNYSTRPSLFYYRGKSKVYVIPEYIQLNNGKCFSIKLPVQTDDFLRPTNIKPCKDQNGKLIKRIDSSSELRNKNNKICIEGRRPKIINSGIVGAGAGGFLAALDANNNNDRISIGTLTVINQGAGVSGITDLLAGKNADISNLLIIEVQLSEETSGKKEFVPPAKPE